MNRRFPVVIVTVALLMVASCGKKTLTLKQYEKNLASSGVRTSKKQPKIAGLIGAKNGYGFLIDGEGCTDEESFWLSDTSNICRCEIYEFDTSIGSGRKAMEIIKKEGLNGTKLEFNENLGIFCKGESIENEKAVSVLMRM